MSQSDIICSSEQILHDTTLGSTGYPNEVKTLYDVVNFLKQEIDTIKRKGLLTQSQLFSLTSGTTTYLHKHQVDTNVIYQPIINDLSAGSIITIPSEDIDILLGKYLLIYNGLVMTEGIGSDYIRVDKNKVSLLFNIESHTTLIHITL